MSFRSLMARLGYVLFFFFGLCFIDWVASGEIGYAGNGIGSLAFFLYLLWSGKRGVAL